MEELFLRLFLLREELYIVHDDEVVLTILFLEAVGRSLPYCVCVLNRKLLGGEVIDLSVRVELLELVPNCLNKVRFSAASVSIYEKRVVRDARPLNGGHSGGVREFVEGTHDEGIEGIARV